MANYGKCPLCKTQMLNFPGIGPYCPNKKCEVVDGADLYRSRPRKRLKVAKRTTNYDQIYKLVEEKVNSALRQPTKQGMAQNDDKNMVVCPASNRAGVSW